MKSAMNSPPLGYFRRATRTGNARKGVPSMSQIEDITYAQGLRDSLSVMPDLMLIASCPSWHEKGSTWYYADPDLLVLGRVRPGMGTFYAESGNRQFGEYLDADAAKRAVERYYGDKAA